MRNYWMIWYAIVLHWIWGCLLLSSRDPLGITAIASLSKFGLVSAPYTALMYITVAILSMIGIIAPKPVGLVFFLPQQIVLGVSAFGAIQAMATGIFADGIVRPVSFIVADQAPAVLAAVGHFVNVYTNFFTWDPGDEACRFINLFKKSKEMK